MRTPVHRELDAWGWFADKSADLLIGHMYGRLTTKEFEEQKEIWGWVFLHTPVK